MRGVIGIDAAWTATEPSGVAFCIEDPEGWRCAAVAPSYADFIALGQGRAVDWHRLRIEGGTPAPELLLLAARTIAPQVTVEVVAIDMPLSRREIVGRREADDAVSRAFGARGCGTHSPSASRPGPVSISLRDGLRRAGFPLVTAITASRAPAVLEVYPHTALLSLLDAPYRVPYKVSKAHKFWPQDSRETRLGRVVEQWGVIVAALRAHVAIDLEIPETFPTASSMKRYEDAIDALVCAWVGIEYLSGNASAFGDDDAAIWTPAVKSASSCPFCSRAASDGDVASSRFSAAFPDLFPLNPGHTLVVPRRHVADLFELEPEEQADLWRLVAEGEGDAPSRTGTRRLQHRRQRRPRGRPDRGPRARPRHPPVQGGRPRSARRRALGDPGQGALLGIEVTIDRAAIGLAEKVLAILDEGDFAATYKYALLLGLIDVCLEKKGPDRSSVVDGGPAAGDRPQGDRVLLAPGPGVPEARARARTGEERQRRAIGLSSARSEHSGRSTARAGTRPLVLSALTFPSDYERAARLRGAQAHLTCRSRDSSESAAGNTDSSTSTVGMTRSARIGSSRFQVTRSGFDERLLLLPGRRRPALAI